MIEAAIFECLMKAVFEIDGRWWWLSVHKDLSNGFWKKWKL